MNITTHIAFPLVLLIVFLYSLMAHSLVRLLLDMVLAILVGHGVIHHAYSESWFVMFCWILSGRMLSRCFWDGFSELWLRLHPNLSESLRTRIQPKDTPEPSTVQPTSATSVSLEHTEEKGVVSGHPFRSTSSSTSSPAPEGVDTEPTLRYTGFDDPPSLR